MADNAPDNKPVEVVPPDVDEHLIGELRQELADIHRRVREAVRRMATLPPRESTLKAR